MGHYDPTFDHKENVGLYDLYFMVQGFCLISPRISVTHRLILSSICRSVTYILWSSDFALYLEDLFDGEMLYLG